MAGVIILLFEFAYLWIYGFGGESYYSSTDNATSTNSMSVYFVMTAVFTILGFGLIFAYFKTATMTGLFLSTFIVSFTMLLSPILQKWWFNVFIYGFNGNPISWYSNSNNNDFFIAESQMYIEVSFYTLKIAMACAISQLVMYTALIGRLSIAQTVIGSICYILGWNFVHMLCVSIQRAAPDTRLFDDYQINNVYLFAGAFGLAMTILIKNPPTFDLEFGNSQLTGMIALIGTFFLFLSFGATSILFATKISGSRQYVWPEGVIGIFIALSASVISTYIFSILFNKKIGIRESILGTISGGVIYGPIAGTCTNLGAATTLGLFSGFLCVIYFHLIFPRVNKDRIYDSMGLFGFGLLTAFIGTFFMAPIILIAYYNYGTVIQTLGSAINSSQSVGYILIWVALSVALGFLFGLLTGCFVNCFTKL